MNILDKLKINHRPSAGALDLLKYIGPGLLVTVGFIDPGNWATNLAAGSEFIMSPTWGSCLDFAFRRQPANICHAY